MRGEVALAFAKRASDAASAAAAAQTAAETAQGKAETAQSAAEGAATAAAASADQASSVVNLTDKDDNNKTYAMAWYVQNGHPCLALTETT